MLVLDLGERGGDVETPGYQRSGEAVEGVFLVLGRLLQLVDQADAEG